MTILSKSGCQKGQQYVSWAFIVCNTWVLQLHLVAVFSEALWLESSGNKLLLLAAGPKSNGDLFLSLHRWGEETEEKESHLYEEFRYAASLGIVGLFYTSWGSLKVLNWRLERVVNDSSWRTCYFPLFYCTSSQSWPCQVPWSVPLSVCLAFGMSVSVTCSCVVCTVLCCRGTLVIGKSRPNGC